MQRSMVPLSAGCHHDSCTWDWRDLRRRSAVTVNMPKGVHLICDIPPTPVERSSCLIPPLGSPLCRWTPSRCSPGFIREIANPARCRLIAPGMAGLGAIAIAALRVAQLPTHAEPPNLYPTELTPARAKSPVMSDATAPILMRWSATCAKRSVPRLQKLGHRSAESRADHLRKQSSRSRTRQSAEYCRPNWRSFTRQRASHRRRCPGR